MKSFYDDDGTLVTFDDIHELALFTSNDVVTGEVTGHFVELVDGHTYKVSAEVYHSLEML